MKKIIGTLAVIVICALGWEGMAYAQVPAQEAPDTQSVVPGATDRIFKIADDLNVAVGLKIWFNNWDSPGKVYGGGVAGTEAIPLETDGKGWIPTFGIRYKNFFLSASGMFGQNYKNSDIQGFPAFEMRMQRKEVDANLGYYVFQWLAVSAGYKGVFMNFSCLPSPPCFKTEYSYQGPTAGLSLNIPIPQWNEFPGGFSIYGNAGGGYMLAKQKQTELINQDLRIANHAWYSNFEGGIAYKPPPLPFALSVGYRYQRIDSRYKTSFRKLVPGPDGETDVTKGAVIGLTFVF